MPCCRDGRWHGNVGMWSSYDIEGTLVQVGSILIMPYQSAI